MNKKLDIEHWNRKEHFNYFKNFDEPFFGVTVDLDCTLAYQHCKKQDHSFFLFYLHKALIAANHIENFKYRLIDNEVIIYDKIHAAATISRPDETFGFSYINYNKDFHKFKAIAQVEIERVQKNRDLKPAAPEDNVIHFSSLPWIKFTSMSHARNFSFPDSCPKISFGKLMEENGKKIMPVSIHVHHALMDGLHVGKYIDKFQDLMNSHFSLY